MPPCVPLRSILRKRFPDRRQRARGTTDRRPRDREDAPRWSVSVLGRDGLDTQGLALGCRGPAARSAGDQQQGAREAGAALPVLGGDPSPCAALRISAEALLSLGPKAAGARGGRWRRAPSR